MAPQNVDVMEHNVCIIDKYFSILKKFGYLDYNTTIKLLAYISLQELYNSYNWDEECRKIISKYLNDLESSTCIISSCTSCPSSSNRDKNNNTYYSVSGFPDLVYRSFSEEMVFVRKLIEVMNDYNFFVTNP